MGTLYHYGHAKYTDKAIHPQFLVHLTCQFLVHLTCHIIMPIIQLGELRQIEYK